MIDTQTLPMGEWTRVATGPTALYWALGVVDITISDAAPTEQFDSIQMTANGQTRAFQYSGVESIWVRPVERVVHMQVVQISPSDLFLVDADGAVVVDAAGGVVS